MREIKFRVWKVEEKEMIKFNLTACNMLPLWQKEDFVMQFTGLKDKTKWEQLTKQEQQKWLDSEKTKEEWKGKEIYEGDIVKWVTDTEVDNGTIGKIEWCNSGWFIDNYYELYNQTDIIEVIGNICENPELLEKGK